MGDKLGCPQSWPDSYMLIFFPHFLVSLSLFSGGRSPLLCGETTLYHCSIHSGFRSHFIIFFLLRTLPHSWNFWTIFQIVNIIFTLFFKQQTITLLIKLLTWKLSIVSANGANRNLLIYQKICNFQCFIFWGFGVAHVRN